MHSFYRHTFHLVTPSPWPFLLSINILSVALGATMYFHFYRYGGIILFLSFICVIFIITRPITFRILGRYLLTRATDTRGSNFTPIFSIMIPLEPGIPGLYQFIVTIFVALFFHSIISSAARTAQGGFFAKMEDACVLFFGAIAFYVIVLFFYQPLGLIVIYLIKIIPIMDIGQLPAPSHDKMIHVSGPVHVPHFYIGFMASLAFSFVTHRLMGLKRASIEPKQDENLRSFSFRLIRQYVRLLIRLFTATMMLYFLLLSHRELLMSFGIMTIDLITSVFKDTWAQPHIIIYDDLQYTTDYNGYVFGIIGWNTIFSGIWLFWKTVIVAGIRGILQKK